MRVDYGLIRLVKKISIQTGTVTIYVFEYHFTTKDLDQNILLRDFSDPLWSTTLSGQLVCDLNYPVSVLVHLSLLLSHLLDSKFALISLFRTGFRPTQCRRIDPVRHTFGRNFPIWGSWYDFVWVKLVTGGFPYHVGSHESVFGRGDRNRVWVRDGTIRVDIIRSINWTSYVCLVNLSFLGQGQSWHGEWSRLNVLEIEKT